MRSHDARGSSWTNNQPVSAEVGFESQCDLISSMAQVRSSIPLSLVTMKMRKENLLIYLYWDREAIIRRLMAPLFVTLALASNQIPDKGQVYFEASFSIFLPFLELCLGSGAPFLRYSDILHWQLRCEALNR